MEEAPLSIHASQGYQMGVLAGKLFEGTATESDWKCVVNEEWFHRIILTASRRAASDRVMLQKALATQAARADGLQKLLLAAIEKGLQVTPDDIGTKP